MTAWSAIVMPICLISKCAIDLMGLEYGNQFQPMTDDQFLLGCSVICSLAIISDFFNMWRHFK